ncbi:hypothetical protein [Saccharibacillus alkalitolerans]|uniref:Permease n=1 Tax=Saccharibacillus alkalitolerans TaxID=2705290 RepID=A0ABX0F0F5_9BACL|nr:hypothetical protein [Saccharibacillus alkalitolerans]NGZ74371.1 hypothetical protein [Saccharibacillus alkalitolerans]
MLGEVDKKKWGILIAIFLPLGALGLIFLPSPHRTWIVPVFLALFWVIYYVWIGLEKRKKKLAKTV